jgi:hypothetical protein
MATHHSARQPRWRGRDAPYTGGPCLQEANDEDNCYCTLDAMGTAENRQADDEIQSVGRCWW